MKSFMLSIGAGAASFVVAASAEKAAVALSDANASKEIKPNPVDLMFAPEWFLSGIPIIDHMTTGQKGADISWHRW
ncbi:hypothetical protein PY650_02895 [Rhizobium calliandrae]|uniref:Uncharacterized protein n=1 Tax=Rhizobium calliandrae TaxID=1312182 RepID=A0ABT7K7N8_9HYPH|nr:hypothetical protein [Rhizobium calliandrae]MDL2404619.1 hypothetical protein [Rhizobium calliandrae]